MHYKKTTVVDHCAVQNLAKSLATIEKALSPFDFNQNLGTINTLCSEEVPQRSNQ